MQKLGMKFTDEARAIMESSQKNNPPLGVTGALLFNQFYFTQVLEGDRKAVTDIFCRIANDKRHQDLVILDVSPVPERMFAGWSMGFVAANEVTERIAMRYAIQPSKFAPSKMSAPALLGFVYDMIDKDENVSGQNSNKQQAPAQNTKVFRAEKVKVPRGVVVV